MQKTPHILVLMAALAAGSAGAAGTLAGTTITNTATAEYPDPVNTASTVSTPSNTVSTKVLPKPGFDVRYSDGTTDGGTQNVLGTTTVVTAGAVPGQSIFTDYTLVNNGNVPLDIAVSADKTGSAAGEVVKYYYYSATAPNHLGAEIPAGSAVTVPADDPATVDDPLTTTVVENDEGQVKIVQVVTLPTDSTLINKDSIFGASPVGTVAGTQGVDPLVTPGNGYASASTNYEDAKASGTDLQFVRVTVYAPALGNSPYNGATTPVDSTGAPITDTTVIPTDKSQNVPTETVGTTGDNTPVVPTTGYITPGTVANDPTPGGTPIVRIAADEQVAYPKADANATADTVVFTNTLTNTGGMTDKVQLFPALADGTPDPAYTYDNTTGVFTNTITLVTVRFLDPVTGAVIKASTDPTNPTAALYPTVTAPNNSTVVYRTEVTYPDTNDTAPISAYTVQVGADSLSDADVVSNSTTKNTVRPPAAQFGDTAPGQGADATQTPTQLVNPSGVNGDGKSTVDTDATAVFPMDVVNNGQYNDSYTLSGSVTFTDAVTGVTTTVPVVYYASDGTTKLPRVSTDSASPDYNKFISPVIAGGSEYQAIAVIQVPAGTGTGDYTVTQTATGNYSTTSNTDTAANSDVIRVTPTGNVKVAKFAAKTGVVAGTDPYAGIDNPANFTATGANGAQPSQNISYRIIAKNNYNTPVPVFIRDTVPANTELFSVALSPTSTKTIYRVNSGAWTTTAPAAGAAAGTIIDTALDVNGDLVPDDLAPGATLSVDFTVTVK